MDDIELSDQRKSDGSEEGFEDASDDFPFYDCEESVPEKIESDDADESSNVYSNPSPEKCSSANLRRRRFTSRSDSQSPSSSVSIGENYGNLREDVVGFSDSKNVAESASITQDSAEVDKNDLDLSSGNAEIGGVEGVDEKIGSFSRILEKLDEAELNLSSGNAEIGRSEDRDGDDKDISRVTFLENENSDEFSEENSNLRETRDVDSSLLILLAGLVMKAIGFQFSFLINFITFPIWLIYSSYMFVVDPFRVMRRGREYLLRKVFGIWFFIFGNLAGGAYESFRENRSLLKLGVKFGWGFLWSVYVCVVLLGLFVSAFVVGGILINTVVVEPVRIRETLNFDYTENSPTAFMPIIGCPNQGFGYSEKLDMAEFGSMRAIPLDHKLQVTVSLKLPESDYNRNLGIFQVRVDYLDLDGKIIASSRRPCMLQFRSEPIRLLLTFFKVAPLITGYSSESQDLHIKFRGYAQDGRPTSCLRVAIEQRAEFVPGAGIPEIYGASLTLESEQPLLQRIVWYWRRTLFVWISMSVFAVELLFTLVCCRPIIFPRVRLGVTSGGNDVPQNDGLLQR